MKDANPELVTPGVYEIPCSCGMVYIGQTGRSVRERLNEHIRNTNLNQTEKSAIAQHSYEAGHGVLFTNTKILHKENKKRQCLIKEAIEISKNNNNFNRDDSLKLNHIWTLALRQDGALSLVRQSKQAARTNENAPHMDERQRAYISGPSSTWVTLLLWRKPREDGWNVS